MFSFLNIIFPPKCLGCKSEGNFICEQCFQQIELKSSQQCPLCKLKINHGEICEKCKNQSSIDGLLVATQYTKNPLIKKIVTQFKYKFNEDLAEKLAKLLIINCSSFIFRQLKQSVQNSKQHGSSCCPQKDLTNTNQTLPIILVPIPLHFRRKWQRGFNQAELLAKHISKNTNIPVYNLLKRIKNTPQQAKFNRQERLKNLQGAFKIDQKQLQVLTNSQQRQTHPKSFKWDSVTTDYKLPTVILVDDIASTLTTLEESAQVLKKAGFENVWGLVIARG